MRLLMTADAVGGIWNYSLTLSRALSRHGVSIALALMGPSPDESQLREAARIPALEVHHRPFRLEWMEQPWRDVDAAGEWLLQLARQYRPGVIHINGYSHAALAFAAPTVVVAHSCVCSWWRAVHREPAPAEWNEYRRRVREGLDGSALIVAPTHAMLAAVESEHGHLKARGIVIENGAGFQPAQPRHAPSARRPFIFSAARFDDVSKNLALLEKIAALLPWPVFAAGEAASRQCAPIHLTGRLEHGAVLAYMASAEIFCHPALYEPFGLAPLEAALSGCALALADIPSLRELWSGAAVFFDPRDDHSAAAALNRLIENAGLRRRLSATARARAARFTPEAQARRYLAAYDYAIACCGRETALRGA